MQRNDCILGFNVNWILQILNHYIIKFFTTCEPQLQVGENYFNLRPNICKYFDLQTHNNSDLSS